MSPASAAKLLDWLELLVVCPEAAAAGTAGTGASAVPAADSAVAAAVLLALGLWEVSHTMGDDPNIPQEWLAKHLFEAQLGLLAQEGL
jgi:hypothetical protein